MHVSILYLTYTIFIAYQKSPSIQRSVGTYSQPDFILCKGKPQQQLEPSATLLQDVKIVSHVL